MPLLQTIKNLPDKPGVYQYFDKEGKLLYIGKAKSLKKRIKSYFRLNPLSPALNLSPRIAKMLKETANIEYILVENENDALILENSLIKQLKPKYNILLRDDKTYPYIYVDFNEEFPRIKLTRKVIQGTNIKYFGPFPNAAKEIVDSIYELFPLVQKESCIKGKKACLFYQIKRCLAPCEGKVTKEEYHTILHQALKHIYNKELLIAKLQEKMHHLAQQLRFEEAAKIRDRIKKIDSIQIQSQIDLVKMEDLDIFAIASSSNKVAVVKMFMREGKVVASSSESFFIDSKRGFDKDEAYKRLLLEFYTHESPISPSQILVAHDFTDREEIERFLTQTKGKKCTILAPQKGKKYKLTQLALLNAKEIIRQQRDEPLIQHKLQELLGLAAPPYRIEVFDTSHLHQSTPVGAMIVYNQHSFDKQHYRHYNLTSLDEYSQMREILTRRAQSFATNPPPDMWLIDGGESVRVLAKNILQSVGVDIDVVAIAKEKIDTKAKRSKGSAKDILYCQKGKITLLSTDKRLQFLQRLRDEAHRFALMYQRKQREKRAKEIELLAVKGIGKAKMKRLLDYFGSFENIKKASVDELSLVLNPKDALELKKRLN